MLPAVVFIPPLSGGNAISVLKGSGKVQLIWITDRISDIPDGQPCQFQQFRRLGHAVGDQEILRGFSGIFPKDFAEIASVQAAERSNILDRNIVLEILLDKRESFFNIEIAQAVSFVDLTGSGGTDKTVDEQVKVPDQVKGRFFFVVYNI